jgi:hypothetical protein
VSGKAVAVIAGVAIGFAAGGADAQTVREPQDASRQVVRRGTTQLRDTAEQLRYQIGNMERVLENAVEHGASVWRDRFQAIAPVQAQLVENARVRGYRLDDYGVFFDIDVPSLDTTLYVALQTLDQNGLGLQSAMNTLKTYIQTQAANDPNIQQALKRIELQLPVVLPSSGEASNARTPAGSAAFAANDSRSPAVNDPILTNPEEVFREEVMQSIVDALLDYSAPLGVGPEEWLTVAARRNEVRPRIGLDTNARTFIARVRGGDLAAFRAGQISRDDAIKRVEVRVF